MRCSNQFPNFSYLAVVKKLLFILLLFAAIKIQAQQPPTACFTGDSVANCMIAFTDLSLGNPTAWFWTFIDTVPLASTLQNPMFIWTSPGSYPVTLTVYNAWGNDNEIKVNAVIVTTNTCYFDTTAGTPCIPTGLQNLVTEDEAIYIYPNPSTGIFTVANATGEIQVYDLFGRLLLHSNKRQIDMSSYPAGLYIWSVGSARGKLIKE